MEREHASFAVATVDFHQGSNANVGKGNGPSDDRDPCSAAVLLWSLLTIRNGLRCTVDGEPNLPIPTKI